MYIFVRWNSKRNNHLLNSDETWCDLGLGVGRGIVEVLPGYVRLVRVTENKRLITSLRNYHVGDLAGLDINE